MREKSQIEDMRAALRGDIERAQARREAEAEPWRPPEEAPVAPEGPTPAGSVPAEPVEEQAAFESRTPEGSEPTETVEEPTREAEPVAEGQEEPPGFFARLFSRG